jgi:hypothetical protein
MPLSEQSFRDVPGNFGRIGHIGRIGRIPRQDCISRRGDTAAAKRLPAQGLWPPTSTAGGSALHMRPMWPELPG